jgi:hypothetical protein
MFFIFLSALIKDFLIFAGQSCADIKKKLCANFFFSLIFTEWSHANADFYRPFILTIPQTHFQECLSRKQVDWFGSSCKFFFCYLCLLPICCSRTGFHCSTSERNPHYTVQGFDHNGFAQRTLHIFSWRRSILFSNGGTTWKVGGWAMDIRARCESLLWVSLLLL